MQVSEWNHIIKMDIISKFAYFQMFSQNSRYFFVSWKETIVTTFNNLKQTIESFNILYVICRTRMRCSQIHQILNSDSSQFFFRPISTTLSHRKNNKLALISDSSKKLQIRHLKFVIRNSELVKPNYLSKINS